MLQINLIKVSTLILGIFLSQLSFAGDWRMVLDLSGNWKFSIGDKPGWANPDFDDRNWESIRVPAPWESRGFHGYDGYAWYRTSFTLPASTGGDNLYLSLGYIDDVDEVYLNG